MNRYVKYLVLMSAALTLAAACVKEQPAAERQREMVTISASVSDDPLTKVVFDKTDGDGLSLAWDDGDCLTVISGSQSAQYEIQEGYTEHDAKFRGPNVTGDKYTIIYPGDYQSLSDAEAFYSTEQVQNGNDNIDHLRYIAVLQDIDTKDDIVFSPDWAASHGGTLKQCGVVKFILTLPNDVKSPRKVTLSGAGKDISVSIKNVNLTSSHVLTAYAVIPWDVTIPAGTKLSFTVTGSDGGTWVRTQTISKATELKQGVQSIFRLTKGFSEQLFAGGNGTESSPYLISGARHVQNMHASGILEQGKKTWFKMIDDVDMSVLSAAWAPLNQVNPYSCEVDFDGDGHTIDKFSCNVTDACPGFFSVLYGDMHDVKFTNAQIDKTNDNSGHPCGIIAGYGGYGGRPARIWNVHVNGTVNSTKVNGVGGMFGRINAMDIESCSADCTVNNKNDFTGLIFGYDAGFSIIRNCWTSGTLNGGNKSGGIGGGIIKASTSIYNCYCLAEVNGSFQAGGILGHANMDKKGDNATLEPGNHIEKCIAWNSSIKSTSTDANEHYSSGVIVGYTAAKNYLADCYRKADISFTECPKNTSLGYGVTNQENASPSSPMTHSSNTYDFAYHGKAAASGKSLSQVARDLGWSSTIWDMSGSVPTLTGKAEFYDFSASSGAPSAPTGSNPKPGQGEIRPSAGNGWTIETINEALTLYSYAGTLAETGKVARIFVLDLDLSNPNYKIKFVHASPSIENSAALSALGNQGVAAINGAYEQGSIVFKADGIGYSYMPNNEISWTSPKNEVRYVPNWKSEAAFYYNSNSNLKMSFDGYGLSIDEQRSFYTFSTGEWDNILSSAPMLINDWYPSGTIFVDLSLTAAQITQYGAYSNEDPRYHQSQTHPRTAIAITEGNHFLMITVDGRQTQAVGMSAKQLTNFLVNRFNPRWALNLDGGGSTTMSIRRSSGVEVINYPCSDGSDGTHTGERKVSSHICIVRK